MRVGSLFGLRWMSLNVNDVTKSLTNEEAKSKIDKWLNHRLKVAIPDGREFEGLFKCVDGNGNIVLAGTEEHRKGNSSYSQTSVNFQINVDSSA
jgi:small nuclear ribonucleoprotein (snRNP)-like protein